MLLNFTIDGKQTTALTQGEDHTFSLALFDPTKANAPYNLTGATSVTAKFQNSDGTLLVVTPTIISAQAGTLSASLTSAQTSGLAVQSAAEIELTIIFTSTTYIAPLINALVVCSPIQPVVTPGYRGYLSISRVSSSRAIAKSDDILQVDCSGGAVNITIPAADGSYQKWIIQKVDNTFNRVNFIGAYNDHLDILNESCELITNGTSWGILRRTIPSVWQAYPTGTGPSVQNGPSIMTFADCYLKRQGDSIRCRGRVSAGAADGNGSRLELIVLPTGLTVGTLGGFTDLSATFGDGKYFRSGAGTYVTEWVARSTGNICPQPAWTVNAFLANNTQVSDAFSWDVTIPVSQWNG